MLLRVCVCPFLSPVQVVYETHHVRAEPVGKPTLNSPGLMLLSVCLFLSFFSLWLSAGRAMGEMRTSLVIGDGDTEMVVCVPTIGLNLQV